MADRPLKLRDLRRILRRHGVGEDPSLGNGSHTTFVKRFPDGTFSFPLPTHGRDVVLVCYVKAIRKKFRLTEAHGVSDREFYGG
jgi:hypothetical protein